MLPYRHLRHLLITHKMFSNMYLHWNIKCIQVLASDFGWVCVYPMKTKGKVHEALSLMIQQEGIPPSVVMDGLNEQTLGKFCWKLVDAYCQLKQTELAECRQEEDQRAVERIGELDAHVGCNQMTLG